MAKIRKVIKTGNSLAITVPSKIVKDFNVKEGDPVVVKVNHTKASVTYIFSGHPRQLSLIGHK
ncbi:MAG TPA: AbrB/MazE/SpoVT family DNA-binding domain-containing protein [Candidatus Woesebacteria bacterium]|jgi:antitoxin component of MazEF toxin-antitoxin module|nr:AbrB/MazE/SpoVT family DNA-binding domain-containing protein [Candidatus Shapirobacteria bacterium]HOR02356.1 AbrB/MazE/SpoVT family DNA-binding domain-containing protein [Candidatus Woesebacteria bacterium]